MEKRADMIEETPDHANVKIHPPVLMAIHILAAFLLKWFVNPLISQPSLEWFGFGLVVIGFLLGTLQEGV